MDDMSKWVWDSKLQEWVIVKTEETIRNNYEQKKPSKKLRSKAKRRIKNRGWK